MAFALLVDFTECDPAPANGYNIKYRIAGSGDPFTDAGNFFSSPAGIVVEDEDFYEGTIQSDCGDGNLGAEIPWSNTPPGLRLQFTSFGAANTLVGDANDVADWNTFFDTGVEADTPFTSVVVSGASFVLIGATNLNIKDNLFLLNADIVIIEDNVNCVTSVGEGSFLLSTLQKAILPVVTTVGNTSFQSTSNLDEVDFSSLLTAGDESFHDCVSMAEFNFPVLTDAGDSCFMGCNATLFNMPSLINAAQFCFSDCINATDFVFNSLTNMGGTTGDDFFFFNITGNTINLTIPTATQTDDDVAALQANNTVTLILV